MDEQDLARIAKAVLRELGAGDPPITVTRHGSDPRWRIEIGGSEPATLTIRAGSGTTANHVREQIFTQFAGR
jgi:hypothetical protein